LAPDMTAVGSTSTQTNSIGGAAQRYYRIMALNSGLSANNKVYDGTTTATITSSNVTLLGVVDGDSVSLVTNGYTANFASAGVGTNIPVTVNGLTLGGASAGNYTLAPLIGLTANITGSVVTINSGIAANSKVYDGTAVATITSNNVVLSGVVGGDVATVKLSTNGYTANFAKAQVGTNISVIVSGLTLTGVGSANYILTQPGGLVTNITSATLTVSAVNKSRTFGLPNPLLTASYSGFVNGEGPNVLVGAPGLSTSATTNSPPGPYNITAGAGTLSATNYAFGFVDGTLTVFALPQLNGGHLSSNPFTLTWPTVNNQNYQIEYATNLSVNIVVWTPLGANVVGTGNPIIVTNSLPASPQRYFRLKISP